MTLEMTPESFSRLEKLAETQRTSKTEVLRKALGLIEVAFRAKSQQKPFGIARAGADLETEVVGL
jgi:predicted transcriptional regulator